MNRLNNVLCPQSFSNQQLMMKLVLTVLLSSLLASCLSSEKVRYSQAYLGTQKLKETTVELKDFKLDVRATNLYMSEAGNKPASERISGNYYYSQSSMRSKFTPINRDVFFIELIISPHKKIVVSPDDFLLHIDGKDLDASVYQTNVLGSPRSSQAFLGTFCDFRVRDKEGKIDWFHPDTYKPSKELALKAPISLLPNNNYCFALKFNIPPPSPSTHFALDLGGLIQRSEVPNVVSFKPARDDWVHN